MRSLFIIVFASFLFLSTIQRAQAQRPRFHPQIHEFSLQLFSANHTPALSENYESLPLSLNPVNGLRYKYHQSLQNAVRFGIFMRRGTYNMGSNIPPQYADYSAKKRDIDLKIGLERKFHIRQVQFFGGLDAAASFTNMSQTFTSSDPDGTTWTEDYGYNNIGLGAFVGVRFFFTKHISLAVENEFYYYKTLGQNNADIFYLVPEKEMGFNVLSVYASIHLVKMTKRCTCGRR